MNGPEVAVSAEVADVAEGPAGPERASVAVIGAGPVGVTAANLLGRYGVDTLIIDRDTEIVDYPRAIGVDDETLRTLQGIGLADEVLRTTIQNVPLKLIDAAGHCLADIRPTIRELGWHRRNIFLQPTAEAVLRGGLKRFPHVRVSLGTELLELVQDDDGVTLLLDGRDGRREVRADYVIAADGGRSTVRDRLGIRLEGTTHPRRWVVIDCANDPLDAPYTALHCDPRRPYVSARLPEGHRRWEFMLFPGEDGDAILTRDRVDELLRRHVPDPRSVEVIRSRVYTHHSRVAACFVHGRVALAGDAAHLMPPWAGQGLNTGIRDVTNLCWKLAAVTRGQADGSLLASYDRERRPHATAMIELSDTLGRILGQRRRGVAKARDRLLRAATVVPAARRWVLEMRFKPIPHYREGFVATDQARHDASGVGRMFPQPLVEDLDGRHVRLDEVLGPWFAIVGFGCDPRSRLTAAERAAVEAFGATVVTVVESRSAASLRPGEHPHPGADLIVVEDLDNHLRPWFRDRGWDVVLVRPDRCVAAAGTADRIGPVLARLADRLNAGGPS
ncbi:MAG: bifunctional 3-(3-hydroxy-phenyl)propionate/3-hydroxycinnamic acid hydroxylase [Catenulispora sp.]|nr:bifunctional 3-(3-hydroxy-phenyl)propionate/3-hydroxycinnamic acid hydroxylase [Catenulispora sp.]